MTTPAPLSVDPEQLAAAGGALKSSADDLPAAPPPFKPVGADPLSMAIIGQIPEVEGPIMTQLPQVRAQATETATNVVNAANAYSTTDQQLGGQIGTEMQNLPDTAGLGAGGSAGSIAGTSAGSVAGAAGSAGSAAGSQAGSTSQMMSMPMQTAGQMAQMPMQVMGAVAAVPQGVMQGAQQVGQQVQQMVGQVGESGAGPSGGGGVPASGDAAGGGPANVEPPQVTQDEAAGEPGQERAPEAKEKAETDSQTTEPGRHRRPEQSDSRIDL